jgi:hypothetical protein
VKTVIQKWVEQQLFNQVVGGDIVSPYEKEGEGKFDCLFEKAI